MSDMYGLEHWRKKYLLEAFLVLLVAVVAVLTGFYWFDFAGFQLVLFLFMVIASYMALKALREDLQTRGEALVLARSKVLFNNLSFDYGKGIDENILLNQEAVSSYRKRECFNVITGNKFVIEEDFLYTTVSSKFIEINQTAFRGIILEIDAAFSKSASKGEIFIKKGKKQFVGGLASVIKEQGITEDVLLLMNFFNSDKLVVMQYNEKVYFWLKSDCQLFYQFSLFKYNSQAPFVKRIEQLQKLIEKIISAINKNSF